MARGLVLCHDSGLGIQTEWKMSRERPWNGLTYCALFPVFNSQWVYFSLCFHLYPSLVLQGLSRSPFRQSEGVWFAAYPLLTSSPQPHGLCLGMLAFRRQMLIFLLLQQAHYPCGSYAKKGQPVLTNIYKSYLKDT